MQLSPAHSQRWNMAAAFGAKPQYFSKGAWQKFLCLYAVTKADVQGGTCDAVRWVPAPASTVELGATPGCTSLATDTRIWGMLWGMLVTPRRTMLSTLHKLWPSCLTL